VEWEEGTESGRYLEIWNLVFMQYDRDGSGKMNPLPNPSIDTGAGLERVAAVLQGVDSNYDTDLFRPILEATAELAGIEYGRSPDSDVDFRVIADHLRAVAFLLADGVIPGNEGRGYVLRRILRRALRHGSKLGFEDPFLHRLLPVVTEVMGRQYAELAGAQKASEKTVLAEEEKFLSTVAIASSQVQEAIDKRRRSGEHILDGNAVFRFYDTFGLPLEMIREIAEEERFEIDERGFETALEEQRNRSREATGETTERLGAVRDALRQDDLELSPTLFEGYDQLSLEPARLLALARLEEGGFRSTETLAAGEEGVVVLDRTTFYADAGGQLGDRGRLIWDGGSAEVIDTRKDTAQTTFHSVRVDRGDLVRGSAVRTEVGESWRRPTQRHHTATHLLHLALRHVLGEGVRQAGSLVAPDRLRFDFTYGHPLTADEIRQIEDLVNRWILLARATTITPDRPFQEAVDAGAMALFGEKYGDRVRTVEVPDLTLPEEEKGSRELRSLELCGGCHVGNTGEIGLFLITMERGVASGVRRIEALTGEAAQDHVRQRGALLDDIASELGVTPERAAAEINGWRGKTRELEQQLEKLRLQVVSGTTAGEEVEVGGVKVMAREVPPAPAREIRNMADVLRRSPGPSARRATGAEGGGPGRWQWRRAGRLRASGRQGSRQAVRGPGRRTGPGGRGGGGLLPGSEVAATMRSGRFWIAIFLCATASGAQIKTKILEDGSRMLYNDPPRRPAVTNTRTSPRPSAEIDELIEIHSERARLEPRLVRAVVEVESGFRPQALSHKGAMGLMQLMPDTADRYAVVDPYSPDENIGAGTLQCRSDGGETVWGNTAISGDDGLR
jgi:alanyl-tRNA synthetase